MMLFSPTFISLTQARSFARYCLPALLLHFLTLAVPNPLLGQFNIDVSKVGTTSAPFLEIDAGPKAMGMGSDNFEFESPPI